MLETEHFNFAGKRELASDQRPGYSLPGKKLFFTF
jgi:hypothetical protein